MDGNRDVVHVDTYVVMYIYPEHIHPSLELKPQWCEVDFYTVHVVEEVTDTPLQRVSVL